VAEEWVFEMKCNLPNTAHANYLQVPAAALTASGSEYVFAYSALKCRDSSFVSIFPYQASYGPSSQILTLAQHGILISGVLLVWSIAWVFRQVVNQIQNRR